jgi:predicted permease
MRIWSPGWLGSLVQDIRFASRGFRRSPGFALTVVLTLALGLGILAVSFSMFSAFVLRPFAVRDPYSLYTFYWTAKDYWHMPSTWREFQELRKQKVVFSDAIAYSSASAPLSGKPASVELVSGNYFSVLGGRICMGRPILEGEDGPGGAPVAVASHAAWKNRLNGDSAVIGRKVYLRGQPVEIVGVACPEFNGLDEGQIDFWVPLSLLNSLQPGADLYGSDETQVLIVVGRLKPGMTPEGAKAALLTYGRQLSPTWRKGVSPQRVELWSRATSAPMGWEATRGFLPIFTAFGLILLIACANVSNMILARSLTRQREIGVRISLGAGRARMIRQLLTESLMLALPAALAAFGVAKGTISGALWLMYRTLPPEIAQQVRIFDLSPDFRVLLLLLATAGLATLAFGLAPAVHATRASLVQANRGEFANDYRPSRLRNALVILQVSVCSMLLISAAVALRSERKAAAVDPGLDVHNVFSVKLDEKSRAGTLARLRSLPGAALVGVVWNAPLPDGGRSATFEGQTPKVSASYDLVSPEFFQICRIPFVRGRNFTREEADAEAATVIVSETAAKLLWPKQDAVGQTLRISDVWEVVREGRTPAFRSALVIGVARDAIYDAGGRVGSRQAFAYFPTGPKAKHASSILVRMRGEQGASRRAVEAAVAEMAPGGAYEFVSMQQMLGMQLYPFRALFAVTGFLGALALLLTVSGVYGVLSYLVSQRRREFGIRVALGARERDVAGMVFRQTLLLSIAGALVGAVLALGVAKLIAEFLQPVNVFDAGGYAGGMLLVIAAAMAAGWVPARRASRADPAVTLRCE